MLSLEEMNQNWMRLWVNSQVGLVDNLREILPHDFISSFFLFYFIFKLYNIVLVLPNIEMNPPQVYLCSPS